MNDEDGEVYDWLPNDLKAAAVSVVRPLYSYTSKPFEVVDTFSLISLQEFQNSGYQQLADGTYRDKQHEGSQYAYFAQKGYSFSAEGVTAPSSVMGLGLTNSCTQPWYDGISADEKYDRTWWCAWTRTIQVSIGTTNRNGVAVGGGTGEEWNGTAAYAWSNACANWTPVLPLFCL